MLSRHFMLGSMNPIASREFNSITFSVHKMVRHVKNLAVFAARFLKYAWQFCEHLML